MLYQEAPYYFINGISVVRDHADPLQFYFMPMAPRLRRVKDEATGKMVPQIQLIKYRSLVAGNGGFLNFDVHLGLEQNELDDLTSELKRLARLNDKPKLAPVPVIDGSVHLLLFGHETASPASPAAKPASGVTSAGAAAPVTVATATTAAAPDQVRFVLKMDHAAKPSLYGDNVAAFSVQLDQYGAKIMEDALTKGELAPAVVVYSLDYLALRPAFSVRLHIDWNRVQNYLDESFGHEGWFDSVQIDTAVNKLVESKAITMEADDFVPDSEDQGATADRFKAAQARVRDMITDAFFQSSLPPMEDRPDGWDKAGQVINDIQRNVNAGGIGGIIGKFSYKKQNYTRIDNKRLDVTISERTAIRRTIYPQGHISGLFKQLRDGDDASRYILEVNADDPWFQRRRITVINRGDMQADGITSVQAMITYGGEPKDVLLDKQDGSASLEWNSVVENGAMNFDATAQYVVDFKGGGDGERPTSIKSKPQTLKFENWEINPRELYSIVQVPVMASPNYPWDRYPQLQIELRYVDADNGIKVHDTVLLDKAHSSTNWPFFVLNPLRRTFQYKITHIAADNRDIEGPWTDSSREMVDARDPIPPGNRLRLDIMPVVSRWEDIESMFVDLTYEDAANGIRVDGSVAFTPDDHGTKSFFADIKDNALRSVTFRATTVMTGGMVLEVPPSVTEGNRLLIRPDMKGHKIVTVRPPKTFKRDGIEKITAQLRYSDSANGLTFEDNIILNSADVTRKFSFDLVDPNHEDFEWRADFVFQSGMTSSTDWVPASGAELTVQPN